MQQLKAINKTLHYLFHTTKQLIIDNVSFFFILNLSQLLILSGFLIINHIVYNYIDIFQLKLGILLLRFAIFLFMIGVWSGFFKLIFFFIDKKKYKMITIVHYFHLIPKLLFCRFLSYLTLMPLFLYILNIFTYSFEKYGSNFSAYLLQIFEYNTLTFNNNMTSFNLILFFIALLLPIWYTIRFWLVEFIIIDKDFPIRKALLISWVLTKNYFELFFLSLILLIWSIITLFLGYIFFIFGLTISYIIILLYYRYLLIKQ